MLTNLLKAENIKINLESTEEEECIAELVETLVSSNNKIDRNEVLNALLSREEQMSTAIYPYIAVPHAVCKGVEHTALAIGISKKGIDFDSPDKNNPNTVKVHVVFEIVFDENDPDIHLHVLRDILQIVSNPNFVNEILLANTSQQVLNFISTIEI